jgi:hypothetical protein
MGGRNSVTRQAQAQFVDTNDATVNDGKGINRSASCWLVWKT